MSVRSLLPHPLTPAQSGCPRKASAVAHVLPTTSMLIFSAGAEAESVGVSAVEWLRPRPVEPLHSSGEAFRLFNGFRISPGRCAQSSEFLRMFTVGER